MFRILCRSGSQLIEKAPGILHDPKTDLLWFRCNLGQTYVDGACVGKPSNKNFDSTVAELEQLTQVDSSGRLSKKADAGHAEPRTSIFMLFVGAFQQRTSTTQSLMFRVIAPRLMFPPSSTSKPTLTTGRVPRAGMTPMPVRLVYKMVCGLAKQRKRALINSLGGQRSLAPQSAGAFAVPSKSLFKCRMV